MYIIDIADDHPLVREAMLHLLQEQFADAQIRVAENLAQLFAQLRSGSEPDLVLLDLQLPDATGYEGLSALLREFPQLPVAMLSANDDRSTMLQAMAHGAIGFISKTSDKDQLVHAIKQLLQGEIYLSAAPFRHSAGSPLPATAPGSEWQQKIAALTPQQKKVLRELRKGYSNKLIARELDCGETTVKTHVSALLEKLGQTNRNQLIALCAQFDLSDE
ncbi:response regulator transcription factor [Rheinheimera sp.]|uniref:response regulator transcription factor n=1 Tax=Rheinheimera sp. TaxID=1869214 RepID=UPI004048330D